MAVIQRITDFIPNTLIESQEVDDEFNQLVNLLSGVSDDNDTVLKYNHATDPVIRVDQLGAGSILSLLQNGAVKTLFDNSGHLYIGEGVTDASPALGRINGTGGSGTNIAGGTLELSAGRGTGTGQPGFVAIRHPLRTSSGTNLQALSATPFSIPSLQWIASGATLISNTATETTMLNNGASGATKTVQGGISRAGTLYRIAIEGRISTNGAAQTLRLRVKLGATTLLDTTALTVSSSTGGYFFLDIDVWVSTIGATGNTASRLHFLYTVNQTNPVTPVHWVLNSAAFQAIDLTADQTLDVTGQWGAASANNALDIRSSSMFAKGL